MRNPAQGGASVSLAGDTDSSTPEPSKSQLPMDSVAMFVPWANDREANLRRRLLMARDIGAARAVQTSEPLRRDLFWMINDLAGGWVFSGATEEQLTEVRKAAGYLFLACNALGRVEDPS